MTFFIPYLVSFKKYQLLDKEREDKYLYHSLYSYHLSEVGLASLAQAIGFRWFTTFYSSSALYISFS
ncbi:unnamed protein product [Moneuplotes crassus]|uniref:Uncharacterized protein n=1 Tax=Euplotes crassus TaxID=5936 RepID=A0AAD1XQ40_EUPCR|nr:unnamed protein product [Moneuplotes crassus]